MCIYEDYEAKSLENQGFKRSTFRDYRSGLILGSPLLAKKEPSVAQYITFPHAKSPSTRPALGSQRNAWKMSTIGRDNRPPRVLN